MIVIKPKLYSHLLLLSFFILKNSYALESLSYSGRLVQTNGAPVVGPVDLKAELVYTNNLSTVLCSDDISGVALSKGVFHVKLDFSCTGGKTLTEVLSQAPSGESVAIQITDVTNSKSYSYQAIHALPYANVASQLVQMSAGDGQVLKWSNANKKWEPGTITLTGGTVTNVSTASPLSVSNATSTPAISISQANGSQDGYLSSADWNTFNNKEGSLVGGTTAQYYRGDKTWQTLDSSVVPENTNLYFTNARVLGVPLTGFSAGSGAIVATDTVLDAFGKVQGQINSANTNSANYLIKNSTDSVTGVVNVGTTGLLQLVYTPVGLNDATNKSYVDSEVSNSAALKVSKSGDTVTGVLTLDNDLKIKGGSNYVTVKGHATSAAYNLFLPQTAGTSGYLLSTDGSGNTSWVTPTIASSNITDGTIVDADVNASAAIAQSKISGLTTSLSGKEPTITAGTAAQYWKGDKTWSSLQTDSQALVMNNYSVGTNTSLANTDTLSGALGKIQGQINATNTAVAGKEPTITAGTTAQYYRGDKTWSTFATDAINSVLSTFAVGSGTKPAVTSSDSIVGAFGKVQKNLNDINSDYVSKTANQTINGSLAINSVTGFITVPTPVNPNDAANKSYVDSFGQWIQGTGANSGDVYRSSGNVGVGTATPGAKLEVAGQVKITGGTPGAGKVLTSDAAGLASWATLSGDNLGNHTATQNINLGTYKLVGNGGSEGITIDSSGNIRLGSVGGSTGITIGPATSTTGSTWGSIAGGFNSTSSSISSFAFGSYTTASNWYAFATGEGTTASGRSSVAMGEDITVSGANSIGFGLAQNGTPPVVSTPSTMAIMGGSVGIGTTTPGSKLHVSGGEVQLGSSGAGCSATNEGAQRYNSTSKQMEFCNGTAWGTVGGSGSAPVASIETMMTAACPTGYLAANGSAVSRTTYSTLFTAVGVMYGAGDGSTTFNLPDLRGYFLRGTNAASGRDPDVASRTNRGDGTTGDAVGTKQADVYGSHSHGHDGYFASTYTVGDGDLDGSTVATGYDKTTISGTISASGGNETRPKNINVLYCIKY